MCRANFHVQAWVFTVGMLVSTLIPGTAHAFEVDPNNTIPGIVANKLVANGNGADWLTAALLMELDSGSVYNDPTLDSQLPQQNIWGIFPDLEFDSWVGVPGDNTTSILGSAADLGDAPGPAVIAGQKVSVSWYNSSPTNTGPTRIANIALSEYAQGIFSLRASFSGPEPIVLFETGWVVDGIAYFDLPGDVDGDGFVGLSDLDIILASWNQSVPPGNSQADLTNDDYVGLDDLDIVLNNWNIGTPPVTAVPEPMVASILGFGIAGMVVRRRR